MQGCAELAEAPRGERSTQRSSGTAGGGGRTPHPQPLHSGLSPELPAESGGPVSPQQDLLACPRWACILPAARLGRILKLTGGGISGPVWNPGRHAEGAGGVSRTVSHLPAVGDVLDPGQCVSRELGAEGHLLSAVPASDWPLLAARGTRDGVAPWLGRGQTVGEDVDQLV